MGGASFEGAADVVVAFFIEEEGVFPCGGFEVRLVRGTGTGVAPDVVAEVHGFVVPEAVAEARGAGPHGEDGDGGEHEPDPAAGGWGDDGAAVVGSDGSGGEGPPALGEEGDEEEGEGEGGSPPEARGDEVVEFRAFRGVPAGEEFGVPWFDGLDEEGGERDG